MKFPTAKEISEIPGMSGDDGTEQRRTADTTNIVGNPVNSGTHTCKYCKKDKDSFVMHWTTTPKLCEACFRDF